MTKTSSYVCQACGLSGFSWAIWQCSCGSHYPQDMGECPACGDAKPDETMPIAVRPDAEIVRLPMGEDEATRITKRIKSSVEQL